MWNNCYRSQLASDYLIAVIPANGQELNPAPSGSNNRPVNPAGTQVPNATWGGSISRSPNQTGSQVPNATWRGSIGRSPNQARGQAINPAYGIPLMAIPVSRGCPLTLTVGRASDYYGRLLCQPPCGAPLYHYGPYPYQYPLYASGSYSYPQRYPYPHQYQHGIYAFPNQYLIYPDEPNENSRYSGPAQFSRYADETNEADTPTAEEAQSSTPSSEEPPVDGQRSFDCAFCRFRAENESLFRRHNNSCKGPKKGKSQK